MNLRKKLSLGIILLIGLSAFVSCNKNTSKNDSATESRTVSVGGIANFTYSDSLLLNPDVPFELLVDEEYKKLLPDTFNYDRFKPEVVLVAQNLDLKDSLALKSFPNIVLNLENPEDASRIYLSDAIKANILESILRGINGTAYKISDWKNIDTFLTKDSINGLMVSYTQVGADNKALNIDNTYLFPRGKMIRITLVSPDGTYTKWKQYYNDIVNSVVFKQ